ncbi:AGAP008958-PA-like protein [Anopheles sinensis]|uniref:AGAP008958-PA-like protein n=1 Tax=Anopheles sinensis TaxID=74873 RepID=A0A084WQH3_ANOSI|nr:AGAP008958-PA-like protein [Anopheles sinensis]
MFVLLILLQTFIFLQSLAIEVVYEKAEQLLGYDVLSSTLRVRKYNRTTTVLNGTFTFKVDMDDSFMIYTDFLHSSLGNQQFNMYPIKLPTMGMCKFIKFFHDNYPEVYQSIINFPEKGACPITARHFHLIDSIFPTKAIPPTFPKGLWKAVLTTKATTNLFHSSLGNQQFNHYPMKLPTQGICDFIDHVYDNYAEQIKEIINFPPKGECPVKLREVQTDFLHSSLGNQQFNQYPIKPPTMGLCKGMDFMHETYPEFVQSIINFPEKGSCPVTARDFHVIDEIFPTETVLPTVPKGLWKIVLTTKIDGMVRITLEVVVKAYSDKFF